MSVERLARIALMVATTATLSFVRIPLPFSPVPITGQTLGTMLAGVLLGPGDGALSQAVYVFLGVAGLPLFGGFAGPGVLLGPTGGYLIGLIGGAWIAGWLADRGEGAFFILAGCFLGGVVAVYIPGILWLSHLTRMGLEGAFLAGALPYLPGDLLKVGATYLVAERLDFLRRPRLKN